MSTIESNAGISGLVARCYSSRCDGDRERMLEMALRDLWRNYPEWPSTFSRCFNDDCTGHGRGGGLCSDCVTACIAEITGDATAAADMQRAIGQARAAARNLRDLV